MALGAVGGRRSAAALMAAVAAVGVLNIGAEMAAGVTTTWFGPAGIVDTWFDASAWVPSVPTILDTTYINNGGAPTINSGAAMSGTLYLGNSFAQSGG